MFYLEGDRLFLTHYCDSGNRLRMEATFSEDGNTVTFDLVDIVGPMTNGHMSRAVLTLDHNGHVEEWTYVLPNGAQVRVSSELRRLELNWQQARLRPLPDRIASGEPRRKRRDVFDVPRRPRGYPSAYGEMTR